ncbi:MAG TPA: hypothetical protein VFA20_03930 [Myxococcaceae bacterium]|nr:hypothetical protein [Myxococcaceae bacterium]
MAINLESHAFPAAAVYGSPATVQDQQGEGHGQQAAAQDTGYSASSAFEQNPGASIAHAGIQDQEAAGGGDLLSKLSGFIRAVGDVVVQLGEYIRSASGALGDTLAGQAAPAEPQAPAAPAAAAPQPVPLGTPVGAPAPTAPGAQPALIAPQANAAATLAAPPRQTSPSLNARPAAPASTANASSATSAASAGESAPDLSALVATPRGGGARSSQSSGYPVLNPLPAYLGDGLGFFNFGESAAAAPAQPQAQDAGFQGFEASIGTTGFEGFQGFEATTGNQEPEAALPQNASALPAQPVAAQTSGLNPIAQIQAFENAHIDQVGLNNVIPFPGPAARDALAGEASNDVTGAATEKPQAETTTPRYSGMVFRPAFYGNLRC